MTAKILGTLILDEKLFNDVIETILIFEVKVMLAVWEDDKAENVNFKSIIILQLKGQVMDRVPGEAWVSGFRNCHGEIGLLGKLNMAFLHFFAKFLVYVFDDFSKFWSVYSTLKKHQICQIKIGKK